MMKSSHGDQGLGDDSMTLSTPSDSHFNDIVDKQTHRQTVRPKSTWRHLFAFTERQHIGSLALAVLAAACAAGAKTSYAVFLGKVMDVVTPLGAGTITRDSAMASVTFWCEILTVVGAAAWIFNALFMAAWVIFGESIARSTRETLFTNLLYKDMAWFDSQEEGISSVLSSMQV